MDIKGLLNNASSNRVKGVNHANQGREVMAKRKQDMIKAAAKYEAKPAGYDLPNTQYSHEIIVEAAIQYAMCGNVSKVARILDIPRETIQTWRKSELWFDTVTRFHHENQDALMAKYSKVALDSVSAQQERLDNGNTVIDKEGNERRVPVSYRDLVIGGGTATDKVRLMLNQPTKITSNNSQNVDNLLKKLEEIGRLSEAKAAGKIVSEQ